MAARFGRQSVAAWLDAGQGAPRDFAPALRGFRGFFLADPEELSLLPLVEQFAEAGSPGRDCIFRIPGGNDRLATGRGEALRGRGAPAHLVRRVVAARRRRVA